jgi:anti-anti-sigma factor
VTFLSLASDSNDVLPTPTSHARAAGREGQETRLIAGRVGPRLRCVTHDLGLGIVQVTLAGRLDIATARQADRALRATQDVALLVVLDLRRVKFVGCTAVRVALMADARARRTGGRLVVLAPATPAPRLFALARLDRRLEIVDRFPGAHYGGDQP